MSAIKDGGQVFPQAKRLGDAEIAEGGLSLRDYFAAKAMQGSYSNPLFDERGFDAIAKHAYKQADAMLAARERQS